MRITPVYGGLLALVGIVLVALAWWHPAPVLRLYVPVAAAGTLLFMMALPYALFSTNANDNEQQNIRDEDGHVISPWYYLLSEPHGGYSLARVQLLLWFGTALVIYVTICIRAGAFLDVSDTMALLLGLGGGTVLLSTAATPATKPGEAGSTTTDPQKGETGSVPFYKQLLEAYHQAAAAQEQQAAAANGTPAGAGPTTVATKPSNPLMDTLDFMVKNGPVLLAAQDRPAPADSARKIMRPDWRDLITDFDDHGDLSRYQYLLLCIVSVVFLVAQAIQKPDVMPVLPEKFIWLVVASQAAYVGTKAVKTAKSQG